MNQDTFTITFSAGELLCLAGSLGINSLSLPGNSPRTFSQTAALVAGRRSLQERGLIRPISTHRWEIEAVAAILTHWLAAPDFTLMVNCWQPDKPDVPLWLHFQQEQCLWVSGDGNTYELTLHQNKNWTTQLPRWLNLSLPEQPEKLSFRLPVANLAALLTLARQKPENAIHALRIGGLSFSETEQTMTALNQINLAVTITRLAVPGKSDRANQQLLFLNGQGNTWLGSAAPSARIVTLQPVRASEAAACLQSLLPAN